MERLVINIPESKSSLVKQILAGLGVIFQEGKITNTALYKKELTKVSTWSDDDIKAMG